MLMTVGIALLAHGAMSLINSVRIPIQDSAKPIALVSGLRFVLVGMAVAGLGGAWIWQQVWLLALALVIGGEELLETSFVLFVLRRGRRQQTRGVVSQAS